MQAEFAELRARLRAGALAVAGRVGLTAIGDTLEEARAGHYAVKFALDDTTARLLRGSAPSKVART